MVKKTKSEAQVDTSFFIEVLVVDCDRCGGKGFIELEGGLVMRKCNDCNGTGKMALSAEGKSPEETDEPTSE